MRLRVTDNEGAVTELTKVGERQHAAERPAGGQLHVTPGLAQDARERDLQLHVDGRRLDVSYGWEVDGDDDFNDRLGPSFTNVFSPRRDLHDRAEGHRRQGRRPSKSKDVVIANRQPTLGLRVLPGAPQKNETSPSTRSRATPRTGSRASSGTWTATTCSTTVSARRPARPSTPRGTTPCA